MANSQYKHQNTAKVKQLPPYKTNNQTKVTKILLKFHHIGWLYGKSYIKKFKVHYCKNFASQIISTDSRHCGPAEAIPKFQISPSQKLRKM